MIGKRKFFVVGCGVVLVLALFGGLIVAEQATGSERFYVGEAACRQCHHNVGHGGQLGQFVPWYSSPHARAYAALAKPEAIEIAKLSGIDVNPFESPVCLQCHTTASDTEIWRRDEAFFLEDGIQCEYCHGPGSQYIDPAIMADGDAAMKAGLQMPDETFCLMCHKSKGSHTAVLKVKPFEYSTFLKGMHHPGKAKKGNGSQKNTSTPSEASKKAPSYIGAMACAKCHKGEQQGYTFSKWRLSAHANSYTDLGKIKPKPAKTTGSQTESKSQASQVPNCRAIGGPGGASPWRSPRRGPRSAAGGTLTNPACLKCHAPAPEGYNVHGVQCETCHGAGSLYATEAVMRDFKAAKKAGLVRPGAKTCRRCHKEKSFDYKKMKQTIAHWGTGEKEGRKNAEIVYKTPFNLVLSADDQRLYVACESSDSLMVVDAVKRTVLAEVTVQNQPHGVCLSADGKRAYVSNRGSDSVSVIDTQAFKVLRTIQVGDEPHGLEIGAEGKLLYVANAGSNDISVVDLAADSEIKRLSGGRGTWDIKRSPDSRSIFVTNNLSHFVKLRKPSISEVTIIDTATARVKNRVMIPEANLVQGVDFSPDGEFAMVTLIRTKNLLPITRVMQGWMITNGIGVLWKDGTVDQLLLDEKGDYFADPTDLVITPDGKYAYVSAGGIDAVAAIDIGRMKSLLKNTEPKRRRDVLPNHLGISPEYVVKRIPVGRSPRGLVVSADGQFVYVADGLDDTVSVISVKRQERVAVIGLGGPKEITLVRTGERIFHSAEITFGRQFSCHTCHPDGGIDGITYDIEPDGLGVNPVDNRTLRGILDTAPFKWTGKNPSLSRQCGPRLAVFFTRIDPFTPEQVVALDRYICTIPRNPNRYRKGTELTAAQRRGKALFERTMDNTGKMIPRENRCNFCHSGPYFTNREKMDVGTRSPIDTHGIFDVPHLNNIYETAPYLHDGSSDTLEEIWTRFNPEDKHGVTNDMTKDQLNDLIEYLKTL